MADQKDPFEPLLFLEDRCHKDGFNEGWAAGSLKGLSTGRKLGIQKGRELGSEVGFYSGFVSTWLMFLQSSNKKKPRITSLLNSLKNLIDELPLTDPTSEVLFANIEKIRAKFRQVCSLLGVSPEYNEEKKILSF